MDPTSTRAELAALYLDTWGRLVELVSTLGPDDLAAPVPACPGWSVADVVAHLTAVAEDALAGRLTRPPTDAETAAQVARFRGRPVGEMLEAWAGLAAPFAEVVGAMEVWPAVLDVASHEHDIRGALGRPGARDTEVVRVGADRLLGFLRPAVPVVVSVEDAEFRLVPEGAEPSRADRSGTPLALVTTRFEAFRWRLGRRSRAQLAAMAWSADPTPVLDHLAVFGPSQEYIVE